MEARQGTRKVSKNEPEEYISNMPENVVTNIMDRLPLQDAVRTSILSRNWRFKWTMLSQLVLDEDFFRYLSDHSCENNHGKIITRLLLHLKGVITKFALCVDRSYSYYSLDVQDINHWILFLSGKGIKDLTIKKLDHRSPLKLPTHLFLCFELKHLSLGNCCFVPPTSFNGFPDLLSLELNQVQFDSRKIREMCPVLETLKVASPYLTTKVKPTEIGKLANLKTLSLFLCNLENTCSSSIFELVGFLPTLQELDLDFVRCVPTAPENDATKITFPSIKTLKLSTIELGNGIMLSFAFEMIKSFPNLQILEIAADKQRATVQTSGICFPTGSLQLCSVALRDLKGSENEACLIKYLITCSPLLKKLVIRPHSHLQPGEQLKFAGELLKLQRAYPALDIDLH